MFLVGRGDRIRLPLPVREYLRGAQIRAGSSGAGSMPRRPSQAGRARRSGCRPLWPAGSNHPGRAGGHRPDSLSASDETAGLEARSAGRPIDPGRVRASRPNAVGTCSRARRSPSSLPASAAQLRRPIWITAGGDISLDPGEPGGNPGQARLRLTEFTLGKQPVGTWPFSYCDGSCGIPASEVAGPGVDARDRYRGPAGRGPTH